MRSLGDARERWHATFAKSSNLSDLRAASHTSGEDNPCDHGLRSVCWKAFLCFENLDRSTWPGTIEDSRLAYASLREHFLLLLQNPDDVASTDPLADDEESPWNTLRQDELLRAEILQDVERCMPEYPFFREAPTQSALVDILFIFCKLNGDVGYRQGMHEMLAPIFWVISQDAIDEETCHGDGPDELMLSILDSKFIEHDAFTLFCIVMQTAKSFYEMAEPAKTKESASKDSPIIVRSRKIYEGYLRRVDRELLDHLTAIDILPQIFVLRWIRLLFGREFPFEHVLSLWDVIFAEDPTLRLVDLICVAMLLRIRWELLEADYTSALTLLLRYPLPPPPHSPKTLVDDAMYLQSHLSSEGGTHIITKYTSRPPQTEDSPSLEQKGRALHTPRISSDQTRESSLRSPSRYIQDSGGIEGILQEAAKGVYQRSERLGLTQALRGAVQQLQNVNNSPRRYISAARRSIDEGTAATSNNQMLQERIHGLEVRNKALAKMLQSAMEDLSKQARQFEEEKAQDAANQLSLMVAKLQFIHVHLEDSTIPLDNKTSSSSTSIDSIATKRAEDPPVEEETIPWSPTEKPQRGPLPPPKDLTTEIRPSPGTGTIPETPTRKYVPNRRPASSAKAPAPSPNKSASPVQPPSSAKSPFQQSRPTLAESSYSWMLSADHTDGDFVSASPFAPDQERKSVTAKKARGKASFLFGDDGNAATSNASKTTSRDEVSREDNDGFTLGTLRGASKS